MKIGIIVAMDKEFAQLQTLATDKNTESHAHYDFVTGRIGDNEVIMMQCGIGKVNAAIGADQLISCYHPDIVISTGVAGGADTRRRERRSCGMCERWRSSPCPLP